MSSLPPHKEDCKLISVAALHPCPSFQESVNSEYVSPCMTPSSKHPHPHTSSELIWRDIAENFSCCCFTTKKLLFQQPPSKTQIEFMTERNNFHTTHSHAKCFPEKSISGTFIEQTCFVFLTPTLDKVLMVSFINWSSCSFAHVFAPLPSFPPAVLVIEWKGIRMRGQKAQAERQVWRGLQQSEDCSWQAPWTLYFTAEYSNSCTTYFFV